MKYEVTIMRTKYSNTTTEPKMVADGAVELANVLKMVKAADNYGAVVTFKEDEVKEDDF